MTTIPKTYKLKHEIILIKERSFKLYQRLLDLGIKEDKAHELINRWINKKLYQVLDNLYE